MSASGFININRDSGPVNQLPSGFSQQTTNQTICNRQEMKDFSNKLKFVYKIHVELHKLNNKDIYIEKYTTKSQIMFEREIEFLKAQLQSVYREDLCQIILVIANDIADKKTINTHDLESFIKENQKKKTKRCRKQNGISKNRMNTNENTNPESVKVIIEQLEAYFI